MASWRVRTRPGHRLAPMRDRDRRHRRRDGPARQEGDGRAPARWLHLSGAGSDPQSPLEDSLPVPGRSAAPSSSGLRGWGFWRPRVSHGLPGRAADGDAGDHRRRLIGRNPGQGPAQRGFAASRPRCLPGADCELSHRAPTGTARRLRDSDGPRGIARRGDDVTIVAYGRQVGKALLAAELAAKEGISAEVIDLRTLRPWDEQTVLDSVARTTRLITVQDAHRSAGVGAEVASRVTEELFDSMAAPPAVSGCSTPTGRCFAARS